MAEISAANPELPRLCAFPPKVTRTYPYWVCCRCGEGPLALEDHKSCTNVACSHSRSNKCCPIKYIPSDHVLHNSPPLLHGQSAPIPVSGLATCQPPYRLRACLLTLARVGEIGPDISNRPPVPPVIEPNGFASIWPGWVNLDWMSLTGPHFLGHLTVLMFSTSRTSRTKRGPQTGRSILKSFSPIDTIWLASGK